MLIRDLQTDFSVADTIVVDEKLILGDILTARSCKTRHIIGTNKPAPGRN
jgi:outer membrane protein